MLSLSEMALYPRNPGQSHAHSYRGKTIQVSLIGLVSCKNYYRNICIFRCNFCDEMFVSATWMGIHRRKMHPQQWNDELEKRKREKKVIER